MLIADPAMERDVATRLHRAGFKNLAGYLENGIEALKKRPDLLAHIERITVSRLIRRQSTGNAGAIVDVRDAHEWQEDCIEDSINIPLSHLRERVSELPRGRDIIVYCCGGYRSTIAASLLLQLGHPNVVELVGGLEAWRKCCSKEPVLAVA